MKKAIFYKEWIKMHAFLPIMAVALLGFTAYALLRINRAVTLKGAAHLWQIMLDKEVVFIEILRFLPAIAGLLLALVQFIPEMSHKRLKLTLHLPFPQRAMILWMTSTGLVTLTALFALQALMLWGYFHHLTAAELTSRALLTALPWWFAGLTLYQLTAWICLEPTWYRRVINMLISAGIVRMFFMSDVPQAYDGMWVYMIILLAGSLFLPLLSVHRFKQGCQD